MYVCTILIELDVGTPTGDYWLPVVTGDAENPRKVKGLLGPGSKVISRFASAPRMPLCVRAHSIGYRRSFCKNSEFLLILLVLSTPPGPPTNPTKSE